MKQPALRPAKLFIWDLDNVIYPYDEPFEKACHHAAAQAALSLGVKMAIEQATDLAKNSYIKYGRSLDVFVHEYGIPEADIYKAYHDGLSCDFLKPDKRMTVGFERSGAMHAVLTHGSTNWAHNVLRARNLHLHFNPEHVVSIEQIGHAKKNESTAPFDHVLKLMNVAAQDAIMIEDTAANLKYAKQMGMQTVFISYGKGDGDGYADYVFDTPQDFLKAYHRALKADRMAGNDRPLT